ncbi:hypothetical protein BD289DRAFT_464932 [Coniella lustricola]|uniref:Adenosine deaminase domain-containing protein n=1 Tax=Coniella lustricola TaxID=2025994 RepID=A0A2T3AJZ9_9PEZI|nr:hypothetical protein BD289DRAFT_464932 [Coniella lustricola]
MDWTALPKIELHAHLSGSISRQCLHEVWLRKKAAGETGLEDPLVEMPDGKHDYDLKTFFPLFSSYIYHLVNDREALEHTTLSVLRDFAADGVVYLELRTTPRALPASNLTKADYIATILDTIHRFESTTPNNRLHTSLILSIDRRNTLAQALEVVDLAQHFASSRSLSSSSSSSSSFSSGPTTSPTPRRGGGGGGVVGIDLCGDPTATGIAALQPAFTAARTRLPHLGLTLHFAEAEASGSDAELLMLLREWQPDRIGHVIHLSEAVKREVAAYRNGQGLGLGLELCLSCNVHAGMIQGGFESHHFGEWWKVDGPTVVLCTDDVGVFGSPLSNEYRLVATHFHLSEGDIRALARKGIDVIFGSEDEKKRLRRIMG